MRKVEVQVVLKTDGGAHKTIRDEFFVDEKADNAQNEVYKKVVEKHGGAPIDGIAVVGTLTITIKENAS